MEGQTDAPMAGALGALVDECCGRSAGEWGVAEEDEWVVHKQGWLEKQGGGRWKVRRCCAISAPCFCPCVSLSHWC
eukprot:COSAG02_NODE_2382_length_8992_cov_5.447318_2_plen_76_part_00